MAPLITIASTSTETAPTILEVQEIKKNNLIIF